MKYNVKDFKRTFIVNMVLLIISLGTLYGLVIASENTNKRLIFEKIESSGGKVESIEERWINNGPYKLPRYGAVYKILYTGTNGLNQEAWLMRGLLGTEWVYDYKEY